MADTEDVPQVILINLNSAVGLDNALNILDSSDNNKGLIQTIKSFPRQSFSNIGPKPVAMAALILHQADPSLLSLIPDTLIRSYLKDPVLASVIGLMYQIKTQGGFYRYLNCTSLLPLVDYRGCYLAFVHELFNQLWRCQLFSSSHGKVILSDSSHAARYWQSTYCFGVAEHRAREAASYFRRAMAFVAAAILSAALTMLAVLYLPLGVAAIGATVVASCLLLSLGHMLLAAGFRFSAWLLSSIDFSNHVVLTLNSQHAADRLAKLEKVDFAEVLSDLERRCTELPNKYLPPQSDVMAFQRDYFMGNWRLLSRWFPWTRASQRPTDGEPGGLAASTASEGDEVDDEEKTFTF